MHLGNLLRDVTLHSLGIGTRHPDHIPRNSGHVLTPRSCCVCCCAIIEVRASGLDDQRVTNNMDLVGIDVDQLLKLRLVVARIGEMDIARWWNTQGQLGALGASVLRRGFPRTHQFAGARSVFAVAAHRTREVYDPPQSVTLWNLPPELEDEFGMQWEHWLDNPSEWTVFFDQLADVTPDVEAELAKRDLISEVQSERLRRLRRSADFRAVEVPGEFAGTGDDITMLALAFARSEPEQLAVPYQSWSSA